KILLAERCEADRGSTVVRTARAVGQKEIDPMTQEEDAARVLPYEREPSRLGAHVNEQGPVAVFSEPAHPAVNPARIEWRIDERPANPLAAQAVVMLSKIELGAYVPRLWARTARVSSE